RMTVRFHACGSVIVSEVVGVAQVDVARPAQGRQTETKRGHAQPGVSQEASLHGVSVRACREAACRLQRLGSDCYLGATEPKKAASGGSTMTFASILLGAEDVPAIIRLLGRCHSAVVHFPIALVAVAAGLESWQMLRRRAELARATP